MSALARPPMPVPALSDYEIAREGVVAACERLPASGQVSLLSYLLAVITAPCPPDADAEIEGVILDALRRSRAELRLGPCAGTA